MRSCTKKLFIVSLCFLLSGCADTISKLPPTNKKLRSEKRTRENFFNKREILINKDLSYLPWGRSEKFDLFMPVNLNENQKFPGIIIIHGGGWHSGDKANEREQNIGTNLAKNGYVCISINYLLSVEGSPSWPQNLFDCKMAVRFLRKHADQYNVDPNNIGVIGGSAGGHLSAMVGLTSSKVSLEPTGPYKGLSSRVQAVVDMYGVNNLSTWEVPRGKKSVAQFLGVTKKEDPDLLAFASPVNHATDDAPPFLIIHGTADAIVPYEQSVELHQALGAKGAQSQLVIVEGAGHSFHLQPQQRDLRQLVIDFFDRHLKSENPRALF